jgi:hypothetical protein
MESTAAGAGVRKKRKVVGASEGGGTWRRKRNKGMIHLVGLFAKKMKEAVASESGDDGALNLKKEGEMLKLREELWEAKRLWSEKLVPGALDRWLERKKTTQAPAVAGKKKKKKVVRVIFPDNYIDYIKENPSMMRELSNKEMAKCPERFRQTYAITKVINAKNLAYQQALIDHYQAFGFAYDEKEVTDEEEEMKVVKN